MRERCTHRNEKGIYTGHGRNRARRLNRELLRVVHEQRLRMLVAVEDPSIADP